jgi:hypothetical protein
MGLCRDDVRSLAGRLIGVVAQARGILHERGGEPICMVRAELLWQHAVVDEAGGGLKVAGGAIDQPGGIMTTAAPAAGPGA